MVKNKVAPDDPHGDRYRRTHRLLRIMEAVRASHGDDVIEALYGEYGQRIHRDRDLYFEPKEALAALDLPEHHADAADDTVWDEAIANAMDDGLALAGDDVGTPLVSLSPRSGERVAFFGPVISRLPDPDVGLDLWDGLVTLAGTPGFWELKRTRTERPQFD